MPFLPKRRMTALRATMVAMSTVIVAMSGCQDITYVRTNPFDLAAEPTLEFAGVPDSTFVLGATFTAQMASDGPLPGGIIWEGEPPLAEFINGFFFVTDAVKVEPQEVTLTAKFGSRHLTKTIVVMQRPVELRLQCAFTFTCDTIRSLEAAAHYEIHALDADNRLVVDVPGTMVGVTTESRDPSIASLEDFPVIGRRLLRSHVNGNTWLVATRGAMEDSVRVVVHQRLSSWDPACPSPVQVGQTVQLGFTNPRDANDRPMAIAFPALVWSGFSIDGVGEATVTPTGELTGVAPGEYMGVSRSTAAPERHCSVTIQP
jgi:hypothetical protein